MKKYFCCFKKKKATISSYVEYYSNRDENSESGITNSLIDAINSDDDTNNKNEIKYQYNPIYDKDR